MFGEIREFFEQGKKELALSGIELEFENFGGYFFKRLLPQMVERKFWDGELFYMPPSHFALVGLVKYLKTVAPIKNEDENFAYWFQFYTFAPRPHRRVESLVYRTYFKKGVLVRIKPPGMEKLMGRVVSVERLYHLCLEHPSKLHFVKMFARSQFKKFLDEIDELIRLYGAMKVDLLFLNLHRNKGEKGVAVKVFPVSANVSF